MRLFERSIYKTEFSDVIKAINSDQFAYKAKHNSSKALIICQHTWLQWLDNDTKFIRVLSFVFRKAFDSVPHDILCEKLKQMLVNPYVINWIINFLSVIKQRVVVDGITTEYFSINREIPQGSVQGPILFSIMINDIIPVYSHNQIVKFADDITLNIKVDQTRNTSDIEIKNVMDWASPLPMITSKTWLKILGITFQTTPVTRICTLKIYYAKQAVDVHHAHL